MKNFNFPFCNSNKSLKVLFFAVALFWGWVGVGQTTFTNNNTIPIPDNEQDEANSPITSDLVGIYGQDFIITNVSINITHSFSEDLIINLVSPDGTVLVLSHFNGGITTNSYANTQFEFGGADISTAPAPFNQIYEPQGGTFNDVFKDESTNGVWTLSVFDSWNISTGQINSFSITFDLPPACATPTNVSASPLNPTSANVYWDNISSAVNGYDWVVMPQGVAPDVNDALFSSGSSVFTNTANFTGLTTGTTYDFYVRSNCGGVGTPSTWSARERFTVSTGFCDAVFYDNGGQNGNYSDNSFEVTTISPTISSNKVAATFTSFNVEEGFDGLLIYDGPNTNAPLIASTYVNQHPGFVPSGAWTGSFSPNGQTFTSTHPTGTLTFLFRSDAFVTDSGWAASIDCGTDPSCVVPENFSVTNVNVDTVDLNWDAVTGETGGYEYYLVSDGTIPSASTIATGSVGTGITTVSVTGLQQTTTYDAYVRTVCTPDPDGNRSEWSAAQIFTTLTSCIAPQSLSATILSPTSVELNWDAPPTPESEGYEYIVQLSGSPAPDAASSADGSVPTGINTVTLLDLDPETAYDVYVRTFCAAPPDEDKSAWVLVSFITPESCVAPTALSVDDFTATTADLEWDATTSINSEGYEWVLMSPGDVADSDTALFSGATPSSITNASATDLNPGATYDAYVRAECSPGDFSDWSAVATFPTPCLPETLPWGEGFEELTSFGAGVFPDCWSSQGSFSSDNELFFGVEAR